AIGGIVAFAGGGVSGAAGVFLRLCDEQAVAAIENVHGGRGLDDAGRRALDTHGEAGGVRESASDGDLRRKRRLRDGNALARFFLIEARENHVGILPHGEFHHLTQGHRMVRRACRKRANGEEEYRFRHEFMVAYGDYTETWLSIHRRSSV